MKKVIKKSEYEDMVREYNGSYPVMLTTDGYDIDIEYIHNYDQVRFTWIPVCKCNTKDDLYLSWYQADSRRKSFKKRKNTV